MKHIWLYLSNADIETERLQCAQEGRDLTAIEREFDTVLALDLEKPAHQPAAEALLDRTVTLPLRADYRYDEPSDLDGIRARSTGATPTLEVHASTIEDRVYGAWTGRCVGCLLGKPVEGWRRPRMWGYLRDLDRWPLTDFFRYDAATPEVRERYELNPNGAFVDRVCCMPEDDDTNYTVSGLAIMDRFGPSFTPEDVATFWMTDIPLLHTCTAERVAYRNFALLIEPPRSAVVRNPYREWIGAQIRADFWGYAAPGDPKKAAEFAWRDACVSHVKNGIYGEMWAAAMVSAAFGASSVHDVLQAGLSVIPERSRLAESVRQVGSWHADGTDYDTAVDRIHGIWDENRAHDWCHTISNAMIVTLGLLWGEGDFGRAICCAVQPCFDTDCNGATVGSIMGALLGRGNIPERWAEPVHDTLCTGVAGYHRVELRSLTADTLKQIDRVCG